MKLWLQGLKPQSFSIHFHFRVWNYFFDYDMIDSIMDGEKLSIIEGKITRLLERCSSLQEEKDLLEQRVSTLESELLEARGAASQLTEKANVIESLQSENQKLQEAQEAAKTKIETILQKLEGANLS